jgi:predicted nucleotidyltransferase
MNMPTDAKVDLRPTPGPLRRTQRNIAVPRDQLADFCRRYHIRKLAFFGSVLRDDFRLDSDVDVLVEFEPGHVPGFAFIRLQRELSALLGRKVDLNTPNSLSRYFRDKVLAEAEVTYAQE